LRWKEICLYLLRILKVNLYRLAAASKRLPIAIQLEKSQAILQSIKELLLGFVYSGMEEDVFETLCGESCDVFTVGIDLFFVSTLEQAQFMLELFTTAGSHTGKRKLLDSIMNLFANHPHASYLVLPPTKAGSSNIDPLSNLFDWIPLLIYFTSIVYQYYILFVEGSRGICRIF
jgi:hypothetical protein